MTPAIGLSHHAVERFRDQLRPALDIPDARRELSVLVDRCARVVDRPAWVFEGEHETGDGFLGIGDDVCLVVGFAGKGLVVITCLVRGEFTQAHRQNINKAKQIVRHSKRATGKPVPPKTLGKQSRRNRRPRSTTFDLEDAA
jgi:hypothetical protein